MLRWLATLWRAVWGRADASHDGYGQSWLADARAARRFRALRSQRLSWRPPGDWRGEGHSDILRDFPILARFGDDVIAWRREGDEDWFIIDRIWHGWPDPPQFAFFAFDAQKRIVTGYDFDAWPEGWMREYPPRAQV